MKTKIVSAFVITAAILAGGALAQTPVVTSAPMPAPVVAASATPTPNQVVYAPRLPSAAELSSAAAAQGLTVLKIEQSGSEIIAVYQYPNGQVNTVAYQMLPPTTAYAPGAPQSGAPTTVVYADAPQVVYYERPAYYPYYWYPPVSLNVGFGFHGGYGFRGGWGFRGHFR